jgi:glutaminyl-peptide cyclotransferase
MLSDASPPAPGADTPDDGRGRFSVRLLVIAIAAQVVLIGGLVALAVNGLPFSGGSDKGPSGLPAQPVARAGSVPRARFNRFDGRAALAIAKQQVDAGQRPAGSPTLRRVAVKLRAMLPDGRFENVPGMPGLRNIVGELPGPGPVIVIAAHYDSENHPKGFVGANDAAAAVGTVIELSKALAKIRRTAVAPGIRFVLFDGEEEPRPTDDFYRDALRGSKSYVQNHAEEIRALILLDYIGAKGVRLPREGTSTASLWGQVRGAASQLGLASMFPDRTQASIFDDHTPFLRAGIPAVDFIDWSYPYKDTLQDTFDKLSADSIDAVGETVVELIRTWPDS